MPSEQIWTIIITVVVLALIAFAVMAARIKKSMTDEGSHKRISKIASSFAAKRGFKSLDNVTLGDNAGNTFTADHVILGDFGVIVIADVNIGQIVYGEPKSTTWKINEKDTAVFLPNPLLELDGFTKCLRASFAKNDIYNVPVSSIVVFAQRFTQPELLLGAVPHTMAQHLAKYIVANKIIAKNISLDSEKLMAALEQVRTQKPTSD